MSVEEIARSEALVRAVAPWLVHFAEAISVLVILFGIVRAFLDFIQSMIRGPVAAVPSTSIRLNLGRALALALEFLLAADILQTVLAPSTEALIQLAGIAVIRTGLNYFLGKEVEQETREVEEHAARQPKDTSLAHGALPAAPRD
jgi:uncharacterized membrane protein